LGYGQVEILQIVQTCDYDSPLQDTLLENKEAVPLYDLASQTVSKLIAEDRLEASIDSIVFDSVTTRNLVYLHIGPKYSFDQISLDSIRVLCE